MLKKGVVIVIIALIIALGAVGCGRGGRQSRQRPTETKPSASRVYTADYGRFSIPKGWKKDAGHSTPGKPFFVPGDYKGNGVPNNISVTCGRNHYAKRQAAEFGKAIMAQLAAQTQGQINGPITASGSTTKSGETVLIYRISQSDRIGTQYYIVGEQRYVLIYVTNVDGSDECDAAARHMVKSFKWAP